MEVEKLARPSPDQVEYLISFLKTHPSLAKGFPKFSCQKEQVRRMWQKLCLRLNNIEGGSRKSWKQWTKYWSDKKISVKKKAIQIHKLRDSQSNTDLPAVLTDVEERILKLIGGKEAVISKVVAAEAFAERLAGQTKSKLAAALKGETQAEDTAAQDHAYLILNVTKHDAPVQDEAPDEYVYDTRDAHVESPGPASPAASSDDNSRSRRRQIPQYSASPHFRHRYKRRSPSSQFARLADRFLRLKEERLEIDRKNSEIIETLLKHELERDEVITQALKTTTEGLKVLTEALRNKRNNIF